MDGKRILEYVIEKDEYYWKHTICQDDEQMYDSLCTMIMYATVSGGWKFVELEEPLNQSSKDLLNKCSGSTKKMRELFNGFLDERDDDLILKPLEPDVIGEFYVLRWDKSNSSWCSFNACSNDS